MKTCFPNAFVLSVMAADRPGIVAAVSRAIADNQGNIDSCSQTVLAGYFTLIMIVSFPDPIAADDLRAIVMRQSDRNMDFQITVRPFEPEALPKATREGDNFVITAFGPDQRGIVRRFSAFFADKGININDLYGHRQADQFVLIGQVQIPLKWDIQMLQADLEQMAAESGYTVRLQHENLFVATNQLRLTHSAAGTHQ